MKKILSDPIEIENESHRIIKNIIKNQYSFSDFDDDIKVRVIHATADFDYLQNLIFLPEREYVISYAHDALRKNVPIITDTKMLAAGISKKFDNSKIICKISSDDVRLEAEKREITRSIVNIEHAVSEFPNAIYAIGNAPTALIRLCELILEKKANPSLIIAAPVGFVNVLEAKEMTFSLQNEIPKIIAKGNKGGTTVACAIINALVHGM